ncbi:chain-length determining protein, partial [Pseudomonadota bacterium]
LITALRNGWRRNMAELERDLDVKRNLYSDLLERFEKARVTGALGRFEQPERIKVIDEPYTPSRPTNLPLIIFIIAGGIGGIALGAALTLLAEVTDTTVRRRDQLTDILGVPVITRVPPLQHSQHKTVSAGEGL